MEYQHPHIWLDAASDPISRIAYTPATRSFSLTFASTIPDDIDNLAVRLQTTPPVTFTFAAAGHVNRPTYSWVSTTSLPLAAGDTLSITAIRSDIPVLFYSRTVIPAQDWWVGHSIDPLQISVVRANLPITVAFEPPLPTGIDVTVGRVDVAPNPQRTEEYTAVIQVETLRSMGCEQLPTVWTTVQAEDADDFARRAGL